MDRHRSSLSLAILLLGLGACREPSADDAPRSSEPAPDRPRSEQDQPASPEGFSWGAIDREGIAIGLRLEESRPHVGERLRYWIAIANHGDRLRRLALFSEQTYPDRLWLGSRRPDGSIEKLYRSVDFSEPSTGGFSVVMELEPGAVKEREGNPLLVPPSLAGERELALLFGGPPHFDFEVESGSVWVEVTPPRK